MTKEKNIDILLNYSTYTIQEQSNLILIEDRDQGEIAIGYNHIYLNGVGKKIKFKHESIHKNFIYYIENNKINVYFE